MPLGVFDDDLGVFDEDVVVVKNPYSTTHVRPRRKHLGVKIWHFFTHFSKTTTPQQVIFSGKLSTVIIFKLLKFSVILWTPWYVIVVVKNPFMYARSLNENPTHSCAKYIGPELG